MTDKKDAKNFGRSASGLTMEDCISWAQNNPESNINIVQNDDGTIEIQHRAYRPRGCRQESQETDYDPFS